MNKFMASLIALGIGLSTPAFALPTFTAQNSSIQSIGAEFASPYDELNLNGQSGIASGLQDVATVDFVVGGNCYSCASTPTGNATLAIAVDGVSQTTALGYSWSSTGAVDTLAFDTASPLVFELAGGEVVSLTFDALSALSGGSGTYSEALTGHFAVPEPSTLAVVGMGLIGIGIMKRKRAI